MSLCKTDYVILYCSLPMLNDRLCSTEETLKAAKEQEMLENEMMPNGGKSKGLFRKSRKTSQQVLTTRGTWPKDSFPLWVSGCTPTEYFTLLSPKDVSSEGRNNGRVSALNYEGKMDSWTHLDIIHLTNEANDTHHPWKAVHTLTELEMNQVLALKTWLRP